MLFSLVLCGRNIQQEKKKEKKIQSPKKNLSSTPLAVFWCGCYLPQKDAMSPLNKKPAALWVKPPVRVGGISYAVLINTLTAICIKMADSCSKPASICPVHRGGYWICRCTRKHPWVSEWDPGLTWEEAKKQADLGPKLGSLGSGRGGNQTSIEYIWGLQLKNYNQNISQSFWHSYLMLLWSDCTGKYLLLWGFNFFFKNVRSMPRHFSLDYK